MMQQGFFPKEVTSNVPLITLTGHEQLHIEQHQGLVDYEPENIVLRSACGLIRIAGAGMVFRLYTAAEAVIAGRIDCVAFAHQEGGR
jgi:sporulation protein YqfC